LQLFSYILYYYYIENKYNNIIREKIGDEILDDIARRKMRLKLQYATILDKYVVKPCYELIGFIVM
jgi:hypothetical protein